MTHLDPIARLDAVAQAALVASGELRAVDLVDACARRLALLDPLIHAVTARDLERARARAAQVSGPLAGVPFLIKDLVAYPGLRCSLGSRLFRDQVATAGSPFTARLDEAGLITVGKSATSELGLLGSTETLLEGVTHNPWDLALSAAGSSGGAAAAVAAGLVPMAHASDGGGSIRIPASVCGLFGLKPSRGRCVATGDVSSPLAALVAELCVSRSVRDSALLLSLVEARGEGAALPPVGHVRGPDRRRLRIAVWSASLMGGEPEAEVRAALEDAAALCAGLGHAVTWTAPPRVDGRAISDAFFAAAGATMAGLHDFMAGALQRPLGAEDLEPFTRALIQAHRRRPADALAAVQATFAEATARYLAVFDACDVVLTPTLAARPWPLGHLSPVLDHDELLRRTERLVGYTPIHNIAGCPAMSVPLHFPERGAPLGAHFAARPGAEATLLGLAYELEAARPWRDRWPAWSFPALFDG